MSFRFLRPKTSAAQVPTTEAIAALAAQHYIALYILFEWLPIAKKFVRKTLNYIFLLNSNFIKCENE